VKNDAGSELEFFVLLARHGSLAAAARALDLTPPAATKRLAQMENRLGVRLVNRSTRAISLTSEGETYLQHAGRILAQLREMEDAVATTRTNLRGALRVNATLGFGRTTIAPLLSSFAKHYPHVDVQLSLTDKPVDLVAGGFDLAVRFGAPPGKRLHARCIMSNRRFLCAAPGYLEAHGAPATLADLPRHRCIVHQQDEQAHGAWRFVRAGQEETVKVSGALSSNDGDIVLGWALDGHGLLIRSEWDLAKYLQSGRLRLVLPDWQLPDADLYVSYPAKRNQSPRARAFIDFLLQRLARPLQHAATAT
jgi:DNA-binding transcriptional LysR family regulator